MFGRRAIVIIPVLTALLISGCNASATTPTQAPAASPTAAPGTPHNLAFPASLQGTYEATITKSTVTPGVWPMVITANDITVTNPNPGSTSFSIDPVDVTGDRITVKGSADCTPGAPNREGVYTYQLQGTQLTFTAVDDLCLDRKSMLTAAPWVRQQ